MVRRQCDVLLLQTAPLPVWPGWYAHQFSELWHQIESWGALGLEGLGAFLILGPRRARLVALVGFTGFQLINLATASYGFFVLLTLALHVFLLDDRDLDTLSRFRRKLPDLKGWYARMPSVSLPGEWQRVATGYVRLYPLRLVHDGHYRCMLGRGSETIDQDSGLRRATL